MLKYFLLVPLFFVPTLLFGTEISEPSNLKNGRKVFSVSGCGSCHAKEKVGNLDLIQLGGGVKISTPFGIFYAPNISPDNENGIGNWTFEQFKKALKEGVSPAGQHYFPSFPYMSYQLMTEKDIFDLFSFIRTLSPSSQPNINHDILFSNLLRKLMPLYNIRYNFLNYEKKTTFSEGEYLVKALGHCNECHTPRDTFGVPKFKYFLSGGTLYEKKEITTPNITPDKSGIGNWSKKEIANYLRSGFTPDYDSSGGSMAEVIENLMPLSDDELMEIAKYLKSINPIESKDKK